ncbi:hypothetical protein [Antrihabitans stalactiti]|uniref:Uncharacterized protein n=1 Tax=Antrihabitans stalactiti TaxID=2584121 RepID=A0A848K8X8_9NOCA|nr:hypothetical protein [Antrihabitans stalactiti]NMN93878.1 hypothetical protein [Antrihabitans stalactiti]
MLQRNAFKITANLSAVGFHPSKGTITMATHSTGIRSTRTIALLAIAGIVACALILAFTVLTWLQVPAPVGAAFGFTDLKQMTETPNVPTTSIQHAYFAWLAWTLLVVVVSITAAAVLLRTRFAGVAATAAAFVALILQVLAAKGPMTWSAFFDTFDQFRAGAYFAIGSWLVLLAVGVAIVVASGSTAERELVTT